MGYRCWAERFVTADFSGAPVHSQKVIFTNSISLKAIRTRLVVYNNPALTAISMRIYSNVSSTPAQLIHTFTTTWSKNQITTYDNGARELYFEFTNPVHLVGGDSYYFVPWITGYTGTDLTHIGWVKAFPDPYFSTGITQEAIQVNRYPYAIGFIGATL